MRDIYILGIAFLFIFAGFNGAQQFVTSYYDDLGKAGDGFLALALIYMVFIFANPLAAALIPRFGTQKLMIAGALFYSLFIISLVYDFIMLGSALLGIGAGLLWTSQTCHLIRSSTGPRYGRDSGIFTAFLFAGSAIGVLLFGFLLSYMSYHSAFLIFSAFPLTGIAALFFLGDFKVQTTNPLNGLKRSFTSPTVLRIAMLFIAVRFIISLTVGIMPLHVKASLGDAYIGALSSLFFLMPLFMAYFIGSLSDRLGRKKMVTASLLIAVCSISMLWTANSFLLLAGIVLIAAFSGIWHPMFAAIGGDISTAGNVESINAMLWTAGCIGQFLSLFAGRFFSISQMYIVSLAMLSIAALMAYPVANLSTSGLRKKVTNETDA